MLVNFDATIKTLDEKELEPAAVMKDVIVAALLANYGDEQVTGTEKFLRGQLAQKIHVGGDIELSIEELTKIKDLVGKYGTPLVVLQIFNLIEK